MPKLRDVLVEYIFDSALARNEGFHVSYSLIMRITIVAGVLLGSVVAHPQGGSLLGLPLDIGSLLKSLGPAPANDPRFTDFHPPGTGDGA